MIVVQRQFSKFAAIWWREQVNFQWDEDDEVCFVLDQHANLDFYSASSLKQQSTGRHVAPLGHIILILNQSVFSGEATNSNFIIFGLTRSGLEPTMYCTRGEHVDHYTTDAIIWRNSCRIVNKEKKKAIEYWVQLKSKSNFGH